MDVVETITNISAASPARQQGFYPYVNCTNVTAAAENSNAGRTGGYNTPMFNVTVEGYQSVKTVEFSNKHYLRKKDLQKYNSNFNFKWWWFKRNL